MEDVIIKQLELGPMANYTYIIGDPISKSAAVIDPGWEAGKIVEEAESAGLRITHILLTHTHFDHASAVDKLAKKTGAKVYVHKLESGEADVVKTGDGEKIRLGDLEMTCLHTPGHTPGSQCFLLGDVIFTGDTLFVDAIGRTDLPESDPEEMFKSLGRLSQLPEKTLVYPGHNYGPEKVTTIGDQKKRNPYMRCKNVSDFLRF